MSTAPTPRPRRRSLASYPGRKRVLLVTANRDGDARLALGREIREIAVALRGSSRLVFEVHTLWAATTRDFRRAFLTIAPDILHICGHGSSSGPIFEHTRPGNEAVDAEALCGWLKAALDGSKRPLEVAVLNFCDSTRILNNLADMATLVVGPVDAVADDDAIMFSRTFYMTLAAGEPPVLAYSLGQSAIEMTTSSANNLRDVRDELPGTPPTGYGARGQRVDDLVVAGNYQPRHRKRTIAFFASEPEASHTVRLDRELRSILDVLSPRAFQVAQHWATRAVDFLQVLVQTRPTVIHLAGHGMADGSFRFEHDRYTEGIAASSHSLARALTVFRNHIECAVLLFEHSDRIALELDDVFRFVVAVEGALSDAVRHEFAEVFYQMLGAGRSYRNAFDAAVATVPDDAGTAFTLRGQLAAPRSRPRSAESAPAPLRSTRSKGSR